jgi:mono/diheme cytochrome c family protein
MTARGIVTAAAVGLLAVVSLRAGDQPPIAPPGASPQAPSTASAAADPAAVRATLDRYCVTCHSQRLKTGGFALEGLDLSDVPAHPEAWEKVVRKLRAREMPPPGVPRPDATVLASTATFLENTLDAAATAAPNPGRVAVHRLSRAEYRNAIRDLLGLELDPKVLLASDEPDQQSFDNLASVLSVSPALLDNYLSAAYRVARLALADTSVPETIETYQVPMSLVQDDRVGDDLPFGSQGGLFVQHQFPADGEYDIKVTLRRQRYLYIMGMGERHEMDVRIDGKRVARFSVGGEGKGLTAPESFAGNTQGDPEWEVYMHTADDKLRVRVPVKAGNHTISVSFVRRFWEPEGILQPPQRGFAKTTNELYHGHPAVDNVAVTGPLRGADVPSAATPSQSESRKRIFVCRPGGKADEEPCARRILSNVASRAYRRPVTEADVATLMEFYREGRAEGDFEDGIERGLERILAAPSFLFRIVKTPEAVRGNVFRVSDLELASRLSFFLWSSLPDDSLLAAANKGLLRSPDELRRQVRRMLDDARSSALVEGFAIQWLKLGKVAGVVPDVDAFPEFDENLRRSMLDETRAFIASQLREDRRIIELVTADYSYINERLAKHYKIPNVYGSHLRRVSFPDGTHGGLLGQAAVMTATSYPNRTSPVLRGKWLLDNILGSPMPAPPADVPSLDESASKERPTSIREQMQAHRRNPTCATCHVRLDPLGFALENFDALGTWRTKTAAGPVDTTATMPDGAEIRGFAGLKALIVAREDVFVRTFTEKLLSYAIGRGVEAADMPAVRGVVRRAAANGYRWSDIITGVVESTPFTMSSVPAAGTALAANTPAQR